MIVVLCVDVGSSVIGSSSSFVLWFRLERVF